MESQRCQNTRKTIAILSSFFMLIPSGFTWYWGNLSVYVYSYIHFHRKTNSHEVRAPWLLSVYVIMWSFGLLVAGQLSKLVDKRIVLLAGIAFFNGGFVSSYFVVNKSITWMDITMGLIAGFGNGLVFSFATQQVIDWIEHRFALASSMVIMGSSVGATLINQLITHYLNPGNLKVDTTIGRTKFFSQKEVLDRVPKIFLILVGVNMSFHIIAFCLVRTKPAKSNIGVKSNNSENIEKVINDGSCSAPVTGPSNALLQSGEKLRSNSMLAYLASHGDRRTLSTASNVDVNVKRYDNEMIPVTSFAEEEPPSKTPSEVLCSRTFYVLWVMLLAMDSGWVLICNYYKAFGEVWIKNDHFLTNLGTALSVASTVSRIVWGIGLDYVEVKTSLVLYCAAFTILNSFYYFTPAINMWLYFFFSLAYGGLCSGVFINFTTAIARYFGKEHFHTNFGLLFTATIAINVALPPVYRILLQHWGWFAVYMTSGLLSGASLILLVLFLEPEKGPSQKDNKWRI